MGRKSFEESASDEVRGMELMAAQEVATELSAQKAEELYGDGQPYERVRVQNEVRFYMEQMGTSLLEMGKRLLRLKAQEGHGGFMQCLAEIGMPSRSANYAMSAATKFGANSQTFANLGTAKTYALTVLEDKEVEDLVNGEAVPEVGTLDEIEKMTVRELKSRLRELKDKSKKEREDLEAVVSAKNNKIDELERQLRYQEPPTKEDLAQSALGELTKDIVSAICCTEEYCRKITELVDKANAIDGVTPIMVGDWLAPFDGFLGMLGEAYEEMSEVMSQSNSIRTAKKE